MIQRGWREQYERMLRSHKRFVDHSTAFGNRASNAEDPRDALFHFFQDAYHLKDWIKNDDALTREQQDGSENAIKGSPALGACADLCNGTKHRLLDPKKRPKGRGAPTTFASHIAALRQRDGTEERWVLGGDPAVAGTKGSVSANSITFAPGSGSITHYWVVTSGSEQMDAHDLAGQVIDASNSWLRKQGLLPPVT